MGSLNPKVSFFLYLFCLVMILCEGKGCETVFIIVQYVWYFAWMHDIHQLDASFSQSLEIWYSWTFFSIFHSKLWNNASTGDYRNPCLATPPDRYPMNTPSLASPPFPTSPVIKRKEVCVNKRNLRKRLRAVRQTFSLDQNKTNFSHPPSPSIPPPSTIS